METKFILARSLNETPEQNEYLQPGDTWGTDPANAQTFDVEDEAFEKADALFEDGYMYSVEPK